jgi:uncharacterized protein (DUF58 family)
VTRRALPKLRVYAALAGALLVAAVALGRPEPAAVAAPLAVFLAVGLARLRPTAVTVQAELGTARVVEGDEVELALRVKAETPVERFEVRPELPRGLELAGEEPPVFRLGAGGARELALPLVCRHFGGYRVGGYVVRAFDRFGLTVDEGRVEPALPLAVFPEAEHLQRLLRPVRTQPFAGNQVARTKGDGIEFADIRPFVAGDRVRSINWRASARRQELHVNEHRPERNADVVLFLDSFAEVRGAEGGTLDRAVRAAAALAAHYLERRDRVGLVGFGGFVRWLTPSTGSRQLLRIVETLIETEVRFSYVWPQLDLLPARTLPPQSLVLALTPLLDQRPIDALADLRRRGYDLVIVEVSPLAYVSEPRDAVEGLSLRLWRIWRRALRYRYERLGIPVVEWQEGRLLGPALEEVGAFRRGALQAH